MQASRPPKFSVFQRVKLVFADDPTPHDAVIVECRLYARGYRYATSGFEANDDEVNGLYDEDQLELGDGYSSAEVFRPPGPLRVRDVVIVRADYEDDEAAGQRVVVTSDWNYSDDGEVTRVGVYLHDPPSAFLIPPEFLTFTGEREPAPTSGLQTSLQICSDGRVAGRETYVVIDDYEWHL